MKEQKIVVIAILALLIVTFFSSYSSAQYMPTKITNVTIHSDGTFNATAPEAGISYRIVGTPGATGNVTVTFFSGNPNPTASVLNGTSLSSFIGIEFNMDPNDFSSATITFNYNDSMVQGTEQPYAVYKYDVSSDAFVEWPSTVDTVAKTITVTLTSVADPLFAIGGAKTAINIVSTSTWLIIVAIVIIIILVNVVIFYRMRRHPKYPNDEEKTNLISPIDPSNNESEGKSQVMASTTENKEPEISTPEENRNFTPEVKQLPQIKIIVPKEKTETKVPNQTKPTNKKAKKKKQPNVSEKQKRR
jgi:hypothetical protein